MRRTALVAVAVSLTACGGGSSSGEADLDALRSAPQGSRSLGVFEGKTPCADCERIKVRLTLFGRSDSGAPTNYLLERIYVGKGDDRTVNQGTWRTTTGSQTDADAVVVQLNSAGPEFAQFQRVGDDILLILEEGDRPRVGDAQHSFTLSRTR